MAMNIFNSVKLPGVSSNKFDLSHEIKLTFSMGELVPTTVMEVLPGDKVTIRPSNFLRFAPLISPVMHKVRVVTDYYFVPNRILWPGWEKWITGESDVQAPYLELDDENIAVGSLADYLGMPTGIFPTSEPVSPLYVAAYLKIYDEYYRDQNLQTEVFTPLVNGQNTGVTRTAFLGNPFRRAWEHDYFTAALPFAQKGDAVQVPLTVSDDVLVTSQPTDTGTSFWINNATGDLAPIGDVENLAGPVPFSRTNHVSGVPAYYDPNGTLKVDIQADATDINTLRRAFRLQEWLERNARAGTRYIENIKAHFGVRSSDARLQRPEFIGRAKQNMVISEVLATAQNTEAIIPVGQMAGHGISVGGSGNFSYRAEEHGIIIGIINVQPDTAYQDGLHRKFSRFDRFDYAWPTFANIGEQEVLQKEVYAKTATPNAIFGYVPRYADYKFENSRVAGEFRDTLAFWHLGRIFASDPALNAEFIRCQPSTRIFAVTDEDEDHIFAQVFNDITVYRKLPVFGTPTI